MNTNTTPRKNWSAISALQNPYLRLAAAFLDTEKDEETFRILSAGKPDLFTQDPEDQGPVPLSAMREYAVRYAANENVGGTADQQAQLLVLNQACLHFNVPVVKFNDPDSTCSELGEDEFLLLPTLRHEAFTAGVGVRVTHEGNQFVVVELIRCDDDKDGRPNGFVALAPAERVAIDR